MTGPFGVVRIVMAFPRRRVGIRKPWRVERKSSGERRWGMGIPMYPSKMDPCIRWVMPMIRTLSIVSRRKQAKKSGDLYTSMQTENSSCSINGANSPSWKHQRRDIKTCAKPKSYKLRVVSDAGLHPYWPMVKSIYAQTPVISYAWMFHCHEPESAHLSVTLLFNFSSKFYPPDLFNIKY